MADIDTMQPSVKKDEKVKVKEPLPEENSSWKVYLKPKYWGVLMNKNKLIYGLNITVYYLV